MRLHHDGGNPANGLDFAALLHTPQPGEKVYCCGPTGFMNAVQSAMVHWPAGSLHLEHFTAAPALPASANGAFEIELASSSKVFTVPADRSILQVLEENGIEVESVCCEGVCGTCAVQVLDGTPDHRDVVFDDEMSASNKWITVCCSRSHSKRLKLAL